MCVCVCVERLIAYMNTDDCGGGGMKPKLVMIFASRLEKNEPIGSLVCAANLKRMTLPIFANNVFCLFSFP